MSQVKFINKTNLQIARENIGLSSLVASKKITSSKKDRDIISEWERGDSLPTWSQVSKLSKLYNIPEVLFFSKDVLPKNKAIPDYRVGVKNNGEERIQKLINFVISRQRWLEKKLKEEGGPKNKLQGSGKSYQSPEELATFIAQKLKIDIQDIKNIKGSNARKETLNYLISKIEDHGVFVGKTISYHKLVVDDMRGLFISNDYCPFIVLNRRDALSAQIFSFIHELGHFFRKEDSISNSLEFRTITNSGEHSEEIFCNKVAAELLLPKTEFVDDFYDKDGIHKASELYKVSEICIFYRLVELGKIRKSLQSDLEKEIKAETTENLRLKAIRDKEREGGGNYNLLMKDSNGALFNRTVAAAYFENKIDYVEASNLLRFSVEMT
jgi:Zn-dependent peptidase ImmA (M78 family)